MPLEPYLRALGAFLQAVRSGMVANMPYEKETQLSYLRLSMNGVWEVIPTPSDMPSPLVTTDIIIPLVLPLAPIILVAHMETQLALIQPVASMIS